MNTKKILFTATFTSSFIQEDIRILQQCYNVTPCISSGFSTLLKFFTLTPKHDITFSWFASVYSSILIFFTKIFKKKSIIILGGVDVAKEKEFNYGIWNSWWKSIFVRYGIKNATAVFAVDDSLKKKAISLAKYDGKNIFTISTGYDKNFWIPKGEKTHRILTVAMCSNMTRIKVKGIDIFLNAAAQMPDVQFVIIGLTQEIAQQLSIPKNVEYYPPLSQKEILPFYQKAKVYAQFSRHEGLPNVLCEAMLCECIPVGTKIAGIPNAIGDAGFLVDINNINQIKETLSTALHASPEIGKNARQRIITHFDISKREKSLYTMIDEILS